MSFNMAITYQHSPLKLIIFTSINRHLNMRFHLHYGWTIPDTPSTCQFGCNFSLDHILSCPNGGFPTRWHNGLCDITSSLLSEVCWNVVIEPHLQPLTGEQLTMRSGNTDANARLDIAANGVWVKNLFWWQKWVFNFFSNSNTETPLSEMHRCHENEKKRTYEQRIIDIEHASFTPLIFSSTGGMSSSTTPIFI